MIVMALLQIAASSPPTVRPEAWTTVSNLMEAARAGDDKKFRQIAPNAVAWEGNRGHTMTRNDVYKCANYMIGGGLPDGPQVVLGEAGGGRARPLPSVQELYDCPDGSGVINFAVDHQKVVASQLTPMFKGTP